MVFSCSGSEQIAKINTEVYCPEIGRKFLVRNISNDDYWESLNAFHSARTARGTDEGYTVLFFRNRYSMQFKGIKSDDLIKCTTKEIFWNEAASDYTNFM